MAIELDVTHDPNDVWLPTEEGSYPAHIKSLSHRETSVKGRPTIIVTMEYQIADEAANLSQALYEMDGYKYKLDEAGKKIHKMNEDNELVTSSCQHLVGKTFFDNGWFVFTDSQNGSSNRGYFDLLEKLEISLEELTVNDKKVKKLVLIEAEDVVGKAVIANIKEHEYVMKDTQEKRTIMKIKGLDKWKNGKDISPDEFESDVPF